MSGFMVSPSLDGCWMTLGGHREGEPAELHRCGTARRRRGPLRALLFRAARPRRAGRDGRLRREDGCRARERRAGDDRARRMTTLAELEEQRAHECRLTPDRALETLDEAEDFLRDRGQLTRTADSALPSLFEACHEEPYARESPGFGQWPATKFPWFGLLGARGHLILAIHRGKSLLVTDEVAALLDPICRAELARMEDADEAWARLLRHLAEAGPSELEDLQTELALTPKELKSLRAPLERCGAIVARSIVYED